MDLGAINRHVQRSFGQQWKFEGCMIGGIDSDNGQVSTTSGYRQNHLEKLGGVGNQSTQPQYGQSVIQISGGALGALPVHLGESDWISG